MLFTSMTPQYNVCIRIPGRADLFFRPKKSEAIVNMFIKVTTPSQICQTKIMSPSKILWKKIIISSWSCPKIVTLYLIRPTLYPDMDNTKVSITNNFTISKNFVSKFCANYYLNYKAMAVYIFHQCIYQVQHSKSKLLWWHHFLIFYYVLVG